MPKQNYHDINRRLICSMDAYSRYKNISLLNERINQLRKNITEQENGIRDAAREIREDLRPVNIIKKSFNSISRNSETRNTLLISAAGFLISILLKKHLGVIKETKGANPIKEVLLEGLMGSAINNADRLKDIGNAILEQVFTGNRNKKQTEEEDENEN